DGLRTAQVGDLTLGVPKRWRAWQPVESGGIEQVRVFRRTSDDPLMLIVWAHRPDQPTSPLAMLDAIRHGPVHAGVMPTGQRIAAQRGTPLARDRSAASVERGFFGGAIYHGRIE